MGTLWAKQHLFFSFFFWTRLQTITRAGVYTGRPPIHWPPMWEDKKRPPCPAVSPAHTQWTVPTGTRRRADTVCCCCFPGRRAVSPEPAACLPALSACEKWCCHSPLRRGQRASFPPRTPLVHLWLAVEAAVRMWSPQRNALHPSASIGEEDEMFFPLSPVPLPPSEHHPVIHLPHRR